MIRLKWRSGAVAMALGLLALGSLDAADRLPPGIQAIHSVPLKESDLIAAFDQSRGQTCLQIPADQPLEISTFAPIYIEGSKASGKSGHVLPVPTCRRSAFSLGLDVSQADQGNLPVGSGTLIMNYINEHYVLIGVRAHRDLIDNEPYLSSRPFAAVATYSGPRTTQEFVETTAAAVNNMRGLGMFMKEDQKGIPENLRTSVMIHRDEMVNTDRALLSARATKPNYELVLIRARVKGSGDRKELDLHAFVTSEQRTNLVYLHNTARPSRVDQCSIKATVMFTDYRFANRIPTASATRRSTFRSEASFSMADLDAFASKRGWKGSAFDNLTELLDAIIDKKIGK